MGNTHLVFASCSDSKVFCLLSSSISVTVTSFSRGLDSITDIGGVTPKYLVKQSQQRNGVFSKFLTHFDFRPCSWSDAYAELGVNVRVGGFVKVRSRSELGNSSNVTVRSQRLWLPHSSPHVTNSALPVVVERLSLSSPLPQYQLHIVNVNNLVALFDINNYNNNLKRLLKFQNSGGTETPSA
jgi:hypothetical protein